MGMIGIGLERPNVRITSYVSRASAATVRKNALKRWYFVPDYQCVRVSDDNLAMEVVGEGVKLSMGALESPLEYLKFVGGSGTGRIVIETLADSVPSSPVSLCGSVR